MTETAPAPGRRREVMVVLPGLMLAIALAMLDNMIVGTAMPRILGELGGLAHLPWVVTAYVLGTTVSTPIWGKIGDLYGRKNIFLASIVLFVIGSVLCGMAGSAMLGGPADGMAQLIAFRAIQGLGAGGVIMAIAMWLLSMMDVNTPSWQTGVFIAVLGLGMGFLMQTTMLIAQNSVEQRDLGVASSASTFFRSIGGSFGVSLFGAVFNNHLTSSLTDKLGPALGDKLATGGGQFNPAAMGQLPPNVRLGFLESLASSISSVFWWAILFAVLVPLIAAFIREIPLRGGFDRNEEAETPVPILE
ncbi:MFS transporter [Streptosporangium subroseum]|uniref:MFS transporter n=1 Tax=Streptosporangium subroseum TaxID=106412 RepID=UPI0034311B51